MSPRHGMHIPCSTEFTPRNGWWINKARGVWSKGAWRESMRRSLCTPGHGIGFFMVAKSCACLKLNKNVLKWCSLNQFNIYLNNPRKRSYWNNICYLPFNAPTHLSHRNRQVLKGIHWVDMRFAVTVFCYFCNAICNWNQLNLCRICSLGWLRRWWNPTSLQYRCMDYPTTQSGFPAGPFFFFFGGGEDFSKKISYSPKYFWLYSP